MKKVVRDVVESLSSRPRQFKRKVQRYLISRGYGKWKKLIPDERDFMVAVRGALDTG